MGETKKNGKENKKNKGFHGRFPFVSLSLSVSRVPCTPRLFVFSLLFVFVVFHLFVCFPISCFFLTARTNKKKRRKRCLMDICAAPKKHKHTLTFFLFVTRYLQKIKQKQQRWKPKLGPKGASSKRACSSASTATTSCTLQAMPTATFNTVAAAAENFPPMCRSTPSCTPCRPSAEERRTKKKIACWRSLRWIRRRSETPKSAAVDALGMMSLAL